MRAVFSTRYGNPDILKIREIPTPSPDPGEVLVQIHATTVNRTDCGMLLGIPYLARLFMGIPKPKLSILGMDFAGTVSAVGDKVTRFKVGDRVFGISPDKFGAHAEYLCFPESGEIEVMPEGMPFREVVVGEGAWYADTYLKALGLKAGHSILVYGASGAIGTAAVQLAKAYGAEVTAVVATRHMELAKSLGAERVVDYTAEDFTRMGGKFDFVFDSVGKTSYFKCRELLKKDGVFTATDLGPWCQNPFLTIWSAITGSGRVIFPLPKSDGTFVEFLKQQIENGSFRAVVDRSYDLDSIVDAYRYVVTEQKTGIVVVEVRSE